MTYLLKSSFKNYLFINLKCKITSAWSPTINHACSIFGSRELLDKYSELAEIGLFKEYCKNNNIIVIQTFEDVESMEDLRNKYPELLI